MLLRHHYSVVPALAAAVILTGCGTATPSLHEFYDPEESDTLIAAVQQHVQCELRDAVQFLVLDDHEADAFRPKPKPGEPPPPVPVWKFLPNWGAQITLVMTVDEKSTLSPGAAITPPVPAAKLTFGSNKAGTFSQSGSVGLGAAASADATRKQTMSWMVKFSDWTTPASLDAARIRRDQLYAAAKAVGSKTVASTCAGRDGPFIQGDLQFRDWLYSTMVPADVHNGVGGDFPAELAAEAAASKKDVLQDDVTFVVLYSGSVDPVWKLLRVTAGQASPPLFGTQRTRTEDLLVTMGPQTDGVLAPKVQGQDQAALIGIAVANAIRNTQ